MTATASSPRPRAASTAGRDFAPVLRALLRRRMSRAGSARGNPFRRLAAAVLYGRASAALRLRTDHPGAPPATNTMPFGPVRLAALGLGLAGGGGGSPGRPASAMPRPARHPAPAAASPTARPITRPITRPPGV